ncbi:MAG: serine/threonine-protein kinase [Pseudomonadota bacterium]
MDALPNGTMLAEFEILGLLGVGGFGMVYKAYDHSLQRTVAIKEYMPSAIVGRAAGTSLTIRSSVDQSTFAAGLTSFVAEARLLARFDHPSLVKVYRFWEANNTAYMAMPLYVGMTLKQARSQMQSPPPEAWLRQVLWSVLEALKVLHENNTLHRDVSPDNIFLQDVGPPVLLDLGSARRAVLDTGQKYTAVLKVNYAPIEQYADSVDLVQGPWTDLYSLAAVIHGCLCNEPPLPATFRVLLDRMPKMASVAETVKDHFGQSYSGEFVAAIDHALSIQPDARPQNVDALVSEMQLIRPDNLLTFDWRADIGDLLTVSGDSPLQLQESSQPEMKTRVELKTRLQPAIAETGAENSKPLGKIRKAGLPGLMVLIAVLLASTWVFLSKQQEPGVVAPVGTQKIIGVSAPVLSQGTADKAVVADQRSADVRPPAAKLPASAPAKRVSPKLLPPSPSVQKEPVVLCPDSNFITRPMCIYQECKKSQFVHLAICIENRNRYPEGKDRINP